MYEFKQIRDLHPRYVAVERSVKQATQHACSMKTKFSGAVLYDL